MAEPEETDKTSELPAVPESTGGDGPASMLPSFSGASPSLGGGSGEPPLVFGDEGDGGVLSSASDDDDEWPTQAPRRGLRLRIPTAILLALLVAAGAFWGGAAVQRSQGTSTSSFAATAARFRAGLGASGASGSSAASRFFGAGSTAAATGTVTDIQGSTLYVTDASGNLVTVKVAPAVKVSRDAASSLSALRPGDTVIVQGATAKNGTVTASSVSATAAGITSATRAGFGG